MKLLWVRCLPFEVTQLLSIRGKGHILFSGIVTKFDLRYFTVNKADILHNPSLLLVNTLGLEMHIEVLSSMELEINSLLQ